MPPEVLIVEDDSDIRDAVASLLERKGFRVRTAEHGAEALDQLEGPPPDVILLDLRMPVMDGAELVRRLRARGCVVPVVVMSAHADLEQLTERLDVQAVVRKPFDLHELMSALDQALRK